MNSVKREAIEKLVEKHNGVWPNQDRVSVFMLENGSDFVSWIEFTNKAEELGYISGYRWGVEYPTSGKRPDLPSDVEIEVTFRDGDKSTCLLESALRWTHKGSSGDLISFRIIDKRYKPKDQPVEMNEMVNSHERGELPPVGWKGEYRPYWHPCEVVAHHNGFAVVWDAYSLEYFSTTNPEIFRPIQAERDKVIEDASVLIHQWQIENNHSALDLAKLLANNGMLKLPEEN